MKIIYNYKVVKQFTITAILWGVIGMATGLFIASELIWPDLNNAIPWLSYGRLRPLHTNAVIFAFGGSALIATSYYVVQRTCQVSLAYAKLATFTFWGWQLVIISAVITLPLGYTTTKEYAELEWPISLLITIIWICYGAVYFGTIMKRTVSHIYVSNWFYGSFIIAIGLLHVINNIAIPVTFWKSYSVYAGAVDAMVQWWYGHNAVGFLLTAGFLGMMYYFLPIHLQKPVYSYRLSIIHFWSLIGIYMWAGAHHLHYSALPDWVQSLGMVFSLMLLAPSWGGMINGVMTFTNAWHTLKTDPIARFMIVALTFYGMSTFEGSFMAIKTVNSLSHNTDWTIGHVHSGALGWVSMITIGSIYVLIPRLFDNQMYSIKLINVHFWLATTGTILYVSAMWISGITQGLMWRAIDYDGTLKFSFIEILTATHPFYIVRLFGGILFLLGMILMLFNILVTIKDKKITYDEKVLA
ncbi:MAG TPA: cytochrome-c oxidase, cbb3-type subunit I [Candidatus Azoamicus sp. OHIO1]